MKRFYYDYYQQINNRRKNLNNKSELFIGRRENEGSAIHSMEQLKSRKFSISRPISSISLKRNSASQIDSSFNLTSLNDLAMIQQYKTVNLLSSQLKRSSSNSIRRRVINSDKNQQFRQYPNKSMIITNFILE
ncbi:unnamed protein product (macronuclear) [Paramecium tetraurelia]|uniref:Uncharacterized protein n=1 Tax=Paramecium tetraurelia TaxID=5888 RepID=A0E5Z5_PARTE|nr:uncharacterized protein GSPATT00003575001 [Paramecium tetraurelia]CAK90712.1 unnamed protein product [Paramecium tetraurelia]|eukprot:XP_001458109.1 hypothetical protein (macronuclear) [Paramecium tetraurelia strain d4-2]